MTLPTGAIDMAQVANELGISAAGISLDHGWVRQLAGRNSGPIDMASLRGKTGRFDGIRTILGGPVYYIDINTAFFGGQFGQCTQNFTNLWIEFVSVPNWNGNLRITNNTTGGTAVLSKTGDTGWYVAGAPGNILSSRGGQNDSFTVLPA